ncbi:MAG: HD domain-containing phosphohydrolase [candidate division FCPU426 bacterium]
MTPPPCILVVDDDENARQFLKQLLLTEGYRVREAVDGLDALEKVDEELPDLVLLDVMMPRLDGYGVCKKLKSDPRTPFLPVVILTSLDQLPDRIKALDLDADDYLTKPYQPTELASRVSSLLRLKHHIDELENASSILRSIAMIVEIRDAYTSDHCREVAYLSAKLGTMLGLPDEALARLRMAATFHDIGKIGVGDAILRKPGPLDAVERKTMEGHAKIGAELLAPMHTFKDILNLVRHHHERLDGTGYPDGLKAGQISMEMRVLTVVDIYEALISERPYKKALSPEKAIEILRKESAMGWWDSQVVEGLAGLILKPAAS